MRTVPPSLETVYDQIADQLANVRALALMRDSEEAERRFCEAVVQFEFHSPELRGLPGWHALIHAFEVTRKQLQETTP